MEDTRYTYCRICEANCGLKATVRDGRIVNVTGDEEHPISRGFICRRGKATLDIHRDPDRLKYPMKKVNGEWTRTTWHDAFADIGARLRKIRAKHGENAVAVYFGNPMAFDFPFSLYLTFAQMTMGTRSFYSSGSQDCNNKFVGARHVYGSPLLHPIPDMEKIEFLLIVGSNPAVSQMSFISFARPVERLREITRRGGRVILIDPRRTETARQVGEHVFIRPDTDIYLLMAMIQVIISEELYDKETVGAHARGLAELKEFVAEYTPERAAEVTGISRDTIAALARDFAHAKNAGIHGSLGVNLGSFGSLCYWLIQCLNVITGRLDRRGSMIFCEGLVNLPGMYKKMPGRKHEKSASRIGGFPAVMGTWPAGVMADEILTPGPGRIKAMIVACGNPVLSVPDSDRLEQAMKSLDLVVSLDFFINETGALADYVLPAKDFYERWDFAMTASVFNPIRFINYADPVVRAEGERRDSWAIMHEILKAAGYTLGRNRALSFFIKGLDRIGSIFGATEPWGFRPRLILRAMLKSGVLSWKELVRSRQGMLLGDHRTGAFFERRILTPDKKADLAPQEFISQAAAVKEHYEKEKSYGGLKLIGQRQHSTHNTWFHNVESLVEKEHTNRVSLNPTDASELGIEDGDLAEVSAPAGSITMPARVTDEVMPGVVAIPHGWGHDKPSGLSVARKYPGVNVNRILPAGPENLEKLAGMAKLTGVRVSVRKAEKQSN